LDPISSTHRAIHRQRNASRGATSWLDRQKSLRSLSTQSRYTIDRPYPQASDNYPITFPQKPYWPVGGAAFRSDDDGRSWKPISDSLIQANPALVPTCVAVHPVAPNNVYVYFGTTSGEIHVSNSRGDGWISSQNLGAQIDQIVVDPRGAANPATTTLYAATAAGLKRSTDGGAAWQATQLLGDVRCLAFNMPTSGVADLYAGVRGVGLYHATDAAGVWTNLSGSGSGLPAHSGSNFDGVLVDFCRLTPSRVYVLLGPNVGSISLYRSDSGPTGFVSVALGSAPTSDLYRFAFAVAPNSPGVGANDVLLFTGVALYRSNNGGTSWDVCADDRATVSTCGNSAPARSPEG
jgi:hypothetical protein